MNKTVTANISGIIFHIEQQAYEKLNNYLSTIRNYFHDSDGKDEIMADIESRIAELFKESLTNGREVITMQDVNRVVEVMGEPEQYMDEEAEYEAEPTSYSSRSNEEKFRSKKLYRDEDDKVLGGVCSGIGHYFGVDRIWFRAAFLISVIFFGTGVLLYLLLWIIIPKAKSTAEKLEMKGEPINVENIGNTIKDEFNSFKKKVDNGSTRGAIHSAENGLQRLFSFIGGILGFLLKAIVKLIGVLFIIAGFSGLITLITLFIGAPAEFMLNGDFMGFRSDFMGDYGDVDFIEIFFKSSTTYYLGYLGVMLITLIPLVVLSYVGLKILFKIPSSTKMVAISCGALFVIGIILTSIAGTSTATEYASDQKITEEIVLEEFASDTLILSSLDKSYSSNSFNRTEIYIENDYILTSNLEVDVIRSSNDEVYLRLDKTARGNSRKSAGERAEAIDFTYEVEENELKISQYIDFPLADKFRNQSVEISIALPVGKSIYLSESSTDIIYDIENVSNTWDGKMIGHTWLMTEEGLKCTDCSWLKEEDDKEQEESLEIEL